MSRVTVEELKGRLADGSGVSLVDVRTPAEYRSGHVAGSLNIPLDRIEQEGASAVGDSHEKLFLICESGKRADRASACFEGSGLKEVCVVDGGLSQWRASGFAVEGNSRMISIERQVRIVAGLLVVLGVVLGKWVHPGFLFLSGFVGAGLAFAGVTDTCGMGMMLARMPWNR